MVEVSGAVRKVTLRRRRRIFKDANALRVGDGLHARLKLQIVFPDGSRLGPGKIMLLETIDSEGSLVRAARKLKMSYRFAWICMQQINTSFSDAAVISTNNGSHLSEFGRSLIHQYRALEQDAHRIGARRLEWLDKSRADGEAAGLAEGQRTSLGTGNK